MKPVLENKRVYLSSPMEYCTESNWREGVKTTLRNNFKLKVFDPYDDPKQFTAAAHNIKDYKEKEDYESLRQVAKSFVRKDLSIVDHADIVIAHVPYKVPTTGCVHEIINSNNAKKVTLLVEGTAKNKIATWYFGFIPKEFMFGTWEELFIFLEKVNNNEFKNNDKFYFLYNYPEEWLA